uniref:NADH dehydrogenase subunit 6 n=1 Tax=Lithoredo abatanica TaxID=2586797 RepID=UPI002027BE85|nr:NADH dehydrogenase subunit 6 [Lithoredo abatanica]UPX89232.1 NADH dehydrogenase subunit 6 [Lithoredo abatanica]
MVSVLVALCGGLWLAVFFPKHPLELSGFLMVMGSVSAWIVSYLGSCLMGFSLFMVMVGGVLVLISFCVALVPFSKDVGLVRGVSSSGGMGGHSVFRFVGSAGFWGFVGVVLFILWVFSPFVSLCSGRALIFRTVEGFLCYYDWAVVIVVLSFYLLMTMIVSIKVSSKYSGALVNKGWAKDLVRGRGNEFDNLFEVWKMQRGR